MDKIGMSLDEIVAQNKKARGGAGRVERGRGRGRGAGARGAKRGGRLGPRLDSTKPQQKTTRITTTRGRGRGGRGGSTRGAPVAGRGVARTTRGGIRGGLRVSIRSQPNGVAGTQVYIGNIPKTVTWQQLKETFATVGKVLHADVALTEQGVSRGYGLVKFETAADAQKAINTFNNADFNGQKVVVKLDNKA
eukprot:GILK01001858.1.p1 GENE.GILK01001858.1~~GILK01001858.1.p1  ORF type:complete len:217 (-),score=21.05 GILK01001858.1:125-700(-)